ncbi:MAG: hypothetical protein WKG06_17680 [Segetibacter sp.]
MAERKWFVSKFQGWQDGYRAFTYCIKEKNIIIDYAKSKKNITRQSRLRRGYDEYKRLLIENGIQFDEKYLM